MGGGLPSSPAGTKLRNSPVGDVQHVVGIVVVQVDLQQAEVAVDRPVEFQTVAPRGGWPRCRRWWLPGCDRRFRSGCSRRSSWAGRTLGCRFFPIAVRSAACVFRSVFVSWYSLENLLASDLGKLLSSSIRPKTPKVFEFFHQTIQANPAGFAWLRPRAKRGLTFCRNCWRR